MLPDGPTQNKAAAPNAIYFNTLLFILVLNIIFVYIII